MRLLPRTAIADRLNRLTKRQLLVLLMVVGLGIGGLGFTTYAFFEDTDNADSNAVSAGTLDVAINGSNSQTNMFSLVDAQPTDTVSQNFSITNQGTTAANHLQVNMSFTENDPSAEPADPDLNHELTGGETASNITVTALTYRDPSGTTTNLLSSITDANGNGLKDLADVQNSSVLDDLTPPAKSSGNTAYLEITLKIPSDDATTGDAADWTESDEPLMADGIDINVHFKLMQDASQD